MDLIIIFNIRSIYDFDYAINMEVSFGLVVAITKCAGILFEKYSNVIPLCDIMYAYYRCICMNIYRYDCWLAKMYQHRRN